MRRECKMHMCNAVCATIHEGFPHLNLGSYEGFPHPNLDFIWREEAKWVWGSQTLGPPVWWEEAKWVWGSQTLGPPNRRLGGVSKPGNLNGSWVRDPFAGALDFD